jgi:hypothetical protein
MFFPAGHGDEKISPPICTLQMTLPSFLSREYTKLFSRVSPFTQESNVAQTIILSRISGDETIGLPMF